MVPIRCSRWLPLLMAALVLTACLGGAKHEFSVSGQVTDQAGLPLPQVEISAEGPALKTTRTDADGRYTLTGLRAPTSIKAAKNGWAFFPPAYTVNAQAVDLNFKGTVVETDGEGAFLYGYISVEHSFPRSVVDTGPAYRAPLGGSLAGPEIAADLGWDQEPSDLIIIFEDYVSPEEQLSTLHELGYEVLDQLAVLNAYLVRQAEEPEQTTFRALALRGIKSAEPNGSVRALDVAYPNDPRFPEQWNFPLIRLPQAWAAAQGSHSQPIRIAVLDTGVQPDHPDLTDRLDHVYGYNFVAGSSDFSDDDFPRGHGTHMAGIIGAAANNGLGIAGVLWDVDLLPIKVLDDKGTGSEWDIAQGLLYAAGLLNQPGKPRNPRPAQVINLSLGSSTPIPTVYEAIERIVRQTDCILVAAAGNDGRSSVRYPAAYPEVIAVGAVDYSRPQQPQRAPYSNRGPELDVMAPGGGRSAGILSTSNQSGGYAQLTGTSMAAPHVSGVIGLMLAAGIRPEQVRGILQATSMPLGPAEFSEDYGYGLINAYWAVNAATTMRLIVGSREGSTITVAAETSLPSRGGYFELPDVPPGEYQIMAWVDVQRGFDELAPGDYFSESEPIHLEAGKGYAVSGTLRELGSALQPPDSKLQVLPLE